MYFLNIFMLIFKGLEKTHDVISNLSSCQLIDDKKSLLSFGLSFALTPSKIRISDLALPMGFLARNLKRQNIWIKSGITWTSIISKLREFAFVAPVYCLSVNQNSTFYKETNECSKKPTTPKIYRCYSTR